MASELVAPEVISLVAGVSHVHVENTLLKADEAVHELEYRAGGIRSLDSPVEHGLVGILDDLVVVLADVREHADIDSGA